MKFHKLKFVLISLVGFSFVVGALNIYQVSADPASLVDFKIVSNPNQLYMEPGEIKDVKISIRNTTATEQWESGVLRLGSVFTNGFTDRPSIFSHDKDNILPGWISNKRIAPSRDKNYGPYMTVDFYFLVRAPEKIGNYREAFRPVLEDIRWLTGDLITIDIQVGQVPEVTVQEVIQKEIIVYRDTQLVEMIENGVVIASLSMSSGGPGYTTPAGEFTIMNHIDNAYSNAYELWMPYWMGIKSTKYGYQGYGFHSLPYWNIRPNSSKYAGKDGQIIDGRLYENNRLYEGFSHLGTPVSHGCIRLGIYESGIFYSWADNGTPVLIV